MKPYAQPSPGDKYGRLTFVEPTNEGVGAWLLWEVVCDCGVAKRLPAVSITKGNTKSCGCLKTELAGSQFRTHGKSDSSEHNTYMNIKQRCYNPNSTSYKYYGARGIQVCDRWLESFENFYEDMGPKPSKRHSVERKDNDGNYEPDNCRWATRREQANNTSRNTFITFQGQTLTLAEWSRKLGRDKTPRPKRMSRRALEKALAKSTKGRKLLTTTRS